MYVSTYYMYAYIYTRIFILNAHPTIGNPQGHRVLPTDVPTETLSATKPYPNRQPCLQVRHMIVATASGVTRVRFATGHAGAKPPPEYAPRGESWFTRPLGFEPPPPRERIELHLHTLPGKTTCVDVWV